MLDEAARAKFPEVYRKWSQGHVTQVEAAALLTTSERTFRRCIGRYRTNGMAGLEDAPASRSSHSAAPIEEVRALECLYRSQHRGWSVRHFYDHYRRDHGGTRSYSWVKNQLQAKGLVRRRGSSGARSARTMVPRNGSRKHAPKVREPRERPAGMLMHLIGFDYEWIPDRRWFLTAILDDGTNRVHSGLFCSKPGLWTSFHAVKVVVAASGLFDSIHVPRQARRWHRPDPGQFVRGMADLDIEVITAPSPAWNGRIGRVVRTLQGRLPKELARAGVTRIEDANGLLHQYWQVDNESMAVERERTGRFQRLSAEMVLRLRDALCLKDRLPVDHANQICYKGRTLQLPRPVIGYQRRIVARVHEYEDGTLSVFRGLAKLGNYDSDGRLVEDRP